MTSDATLARFTDSMTMRAGGDQPDYLFYPFQPTTS